MVCHRRHRRDARRRLSEKLGEIRASADESEPLVVTCVKMCMVQRKMELRERVKDGQNDDKGDLKLLPCSKKSRAEDGSSRAHAACFEALINAGADVDQWDGEGLAPIHHAAKNGDAGCVRFLCGSCSVSFFSFFASRVSRPIGFRGGGGLARALVRLAPAAALACVGSRRWRTGGYQ